MKRRLLTFSICFLIISILLLQVSIGFASKPGVQVPTVKENTFVYDQEKVLSSEQKDTINSLLRYLEEKTSIEFAVITTSSYAGMTIEDYAHDLFNTLRIGKSGKDNGILYLYSATEGHARLEIGYGLEDVLTDSICGHILDDYYVPNRDKGKKVEAISETINGVLAILGDKYNVELISNQSEVVKSIKQKDEVNWLFVIFIIIILCVLVFLFEIGSSRTSYSGGFFSSSSSRGGFGGGFSGGGGASR